MLKKKKRQNFSKRPKDIRIRHLKALAQIKKYIPLQENFRVLDVGCGAGELLGFFQTKYKYGTDINPISVKSVRREGVEAKVVDLETEKLPYRTDFFDLVTCTEVLEHLFDPSLLLSEIKRVLKKGGYVYATVPNDLYWIGGRIKTLFGKPFFNDFFDYQHIRIFNKKLLFELFSGASFEVVYAGGFTRSSFPKSIEEFLSKHFTNIFVSFYSIVARKPGKSS